MRIGIALAACAALWMAVPVAQAGPREDCALTGATMACLDAKLKEANQRLNVTLKAAQERLEQWQANGRRPVMGAFVDSQRKFNAYRDAQCGWQGIRAAAGENSAEYVRECQVSATLAREEELAAFVRSDDSVAIAPVTPPLPVTVAPEAAPPAPVAGQAGAPPAAAAGAPNAAGGRNEWRLASWVVNGQQKPILPESTVTIAFDPTGKIAGTASLNRFSGTYRFDADGHLEWPRAGFALTRMAGAPALMAQEKAFLESLRQTVRYGVEGQQLVLQSAGSGVILTFIR